MVKRNEVIDWHKYFTYKDGKLFHKHREGKDRYTKMWNTRYAGTEAGTLTYQKYIQVRFNGKFYRAHRIIYEMHHGFLSSDLHVDHINYDTCDNRIENLQALSPKQHNDRRYQMSRGYRVNRTAVTRPYQACRTDKHFGTPCGAYMSYATAFVQGENYGNSR